MKNFKPYLIMIVTILLLLMVYSMVFIYQNFDDIADKIRQKRYKENYNAGLSPAKIIETETQYPGDIIYE